MKDKKTFTLTCSPYAPILSLAVGIVYSPKIGWETLAMLYILETIIENFL